MTIVASDVSVKDKKITGFWYLTSMNREFEVVREVYYKRWELNSIGGVEVLTLLELISILEIKGQHINSGLVRIAFDNRQSY